jgi:hypothetical protein
VGRQEWGGHGGPPLLPPAGTLVLVVLAVAELHVLDIVVELLVDIVLLLEVLVVEVLIIIFVVERKTVLVLIEVIIVTATTRLERLERRFPRQHDCLRHG